MPAAHETTQSVHFGAGALIPLQDVEKEKAAPSTWRPEFAERRSGAARAHCSHRGATARNHPGDFPFFSSRRSTQTTPPNRNSTISFFSLPVTSKATSFTEKRQVADDHHVAAVLFERFFRSGNVVLLPSTA